MWINCLRAIWGCKATSSRADSKLSWTFGNEKYGASMNFYCCVFFPVFFWDADFRVIHLAQKGGALVAPPGKPSYGGRKPRWRTSWECVLQSWENCQWKQESLQRQNLKKAEDDKMLALERYFTSSRKKLTECILQEHLQGPVSAVPSAED